jgi:hypothetical protein
MAYNLFKIISSGFKIVWLIYAEVVSRVASSFEAGGLPRYPESMFDEINVMKS